MKRVELLGGMYTIWTFSDERKVMSFYRVYRSPLVFDI